MTCANTKHQTGVIPALLLSFLLLGCQAIVPELNIIDDPDGDTNSDDSETDFDTATHSATDTATVTATDSDTTTGSETDTESDTDTDTQGGYVSKYPERDACIGAGRFWYDETDVSQTTLDGFNGLSPSCHDNPDDNCPADFDGLTTLTWAMRQDGTYLDLGPSIDSSDDTSISIPGSNSSTDDQNITHVFSTLRCFTDLSSLNLSGQRVVEAELGNNPGLNYINLFRNQVLSWLGLPYQSDIVTELHLKTNSLEYIDITGYTRVERLFLAENELKYVDLSSLQSLQELYLSNNRDLSGTLDLSASSDLASVEAGSCDFEALLLADQTPYLFSILIEENVHLETVDLSGCTALKAFHAANTNISALDLTGPGADLEELYVGQTALTELSLETNSNLRELILYEARDFTTLNLPSPSCNLETLQLNNTKIGNLELGACASTILILHAGAGVFVSLDGIDISEATALQNVSLNGNALWTSAPNLTEMTDLQHVFLQDCNIDSIVFADTIPLESLYLNGNNLTRIDIPTCADNGEPTIIDMSFNNLTYSDTDILSFANCPSLQQLYVNHNANLQLHVDTDAFSNDFLTNSDSRIYMDATQWDNAIVDPNYGWIYDTDAGCAVLGQ